MKPSIIAEQSKKFAILLYKKNIRDQGRDARISNFIILSDKIKHKAFQHDVIFLIER